MQEEGEKQGVGFLGSKLGRAGAFSPGKGLSVLSPCVHPGSGWPQSEAASLSQQVSWQPTQQDLFPRETVLKGHRAETPPELGSGDKASGRRL